ncbi:TolC family protein [Sulfurimonas sp. MAG313]|nr:TolC family protein [Sulfurimonas sp. MAG313]MDF1880246.1 TolC family protein [Sulfurimonas sp. MAG313]
MKYFSLAILLSLSCYAQDLSLNQAIEQIKSKNLEVQIADYELKASRLDIDRVEASNYGKLDFTQNIMRSNDAANVFGFKLTSREATFNDFGFSEFGNIPMDAPIQGLNYPGNQNFFQSKLRYELPLYTGDKISAYEDIAKQMKDISSLDKQALINTKIFETRKAYYNMALLESSLKNLSLISKNISHLEKMTQDMIQEGYAKKIDLLEVQSKKANISRIISELKANKELLYHFLSFLLNQDIKQIQLPQGELKLPQLSNALDNNINIQKSLTALKIHKNLLRAESSRNLPTIGAMAEIQTADNSFLGEANKHKSYSLGLQLKWNIFSAGADSAAIEKSRMNYLKMQTQTQLVKQAMSLQLKKIKTHIKSSEEKIINLNLELDLAQKIYENYEGRYKEQLSSMSEVIVKQSNWLAKVLELLKAKNMKNQAIFSLQKLINLEGNPL